MKFVSVYVGFFVFPVVYLFLDKFGRMHKQNYKKCFGFFIEPRDNSTQTVGNASI